MKIEAEGLTFVTEARYQRYVDGLEIDVRNWYGRPSLVADNPRLDGGGCG